tara:strand:+ start:2023 stop:2160 length:138 start_codon:yes stop_codon:yes gene_type:complete
MDFPTIAIIIILFSFSFYLIFLVLGVGGVSKNRSAQGLDQNLNKK